MYGLYQQLKALVFGAETASSKNESPAKPPNEQLPQQEPQKRYFTGEITSLSQTSGMIDQQVFFPTSCVIGCRTPQVGSAVHVVAERPHPLACWHASRVEVTEMWDMDQTEERETVIGFISKLSRSLAVVDCATREVTFDPQCHVGADYRPQTGDWVMMGVRVGGCEEEEGEGEREVTVEYVRPLRERETEGKVTSLGHSSGFIDDDIIFTPSMCGRGQMNVGDGVSVKCVECRHYKASWRAMSVTPLSSLPHSFPPSPHTPTLPLLTPPAQQHTQLHNSTTSSSTVSGLMENKSGLVIGEECDVGRVMVGGEKTITIPIRNTRSHDHFLLSVKPLPQDPRLVVALPPRTTTWCTCSTRHWQGTAEQNTVTTASSDSGDRGDNGDVCDNTDNGDSGDSCENGICDNGDSGENGDVCDNGDSGENGICDNHEQDDCSDGTKVGNEDSHVESGHGMEYGNGSSSPGGVVCRHVHIPGGESLDMTVTVKTEKLGRVSCLLLFTFCGGVRIARSLTAIVSSSDVESLGPSCAYRGSGRGSGGRGRRDGHHNLVPGEKPSRPKLLRLPNRLKPYPVPEDLWECVCEGEEREVLSIRPQLTEPLCMKNYYSRFSSLLHLEEIQREMDMRTFDLTCVPLRACGQYISLEVPGLAEGRPSLLMGDRVMVNVAGRGEQTRGERHWEGYIHETTKDRVMLKFSQEFHQYFDHQDYDVIFQFSRTTFRRMHHAVEFAHLLGSKVLFPGQQMPKQPLLKLPADDPAVSSPSQFFNLVLNPYQQAAVRRILAAQNRPAPYVIFGPPGTGKTMTLVEAILQIQQRSKESRVLACAPSNSAADLLTERLHDSGLVAVGDVVRLNAIQRGSPPDAVAPYCMDTDSMDIAVRCRVVISTCMSAGILHSLGLPVGHFTHVIVDEAGQATETEALLPASLLAGYPDGQLVLAGDPHQLGPILASRQADSLALSLSLLERIMAREPYLRDPVKYSDHGSYDPLMVTKLINNYRSHSFLLQLYSDTFYHGELVPCADTEMTSLMCEWEGLPCRGFPLVFHGVMGEDMREGNSPSWFNPVEIIQVVSYVQSLIDNSTFAPKLSDIGIITPYRKQVEKIRWFLARVGVEGVKVGSVEEFQGQERLVIIISTVRSTPAMVTSDLHHHIGFLSNPKRFNVAISRAQALLVVVGNPHLLCQDPHWCVLLQYAVDNGCYTGCPLPTNISSDLLQ